MTTDTDTSALSQVKKQNRTFWKTMITLIVVSIVVFVLSLSYGRAGITNPVKLLQSVNGNADDYKQMLRIMQSIRIPRALAAFLVGACLSVSGLVYQTTFNNKLVSPSILGVSLSATTRQALTN